MSWTPRQIAAAIEAWFSPHARTLPWREDRTGWRALVSEIMLQQTQVSRVLKKYASFMRRFPTPQSLADASEQELLSRWQGLGYYRRARSLHRAAGQIVESFGGEVPLDAKSLRSLAGVGRYTAGSIASIVAGRREPIVDGNVARLLARLECDDREQDRAFESRRWCQAEALVQACVDPALLNEGMMEFGATVCSPSSPSCESCPLQAGCGAYAANRVAAVPRPKARAKRAVMHHHAVVVRSRGRVLLQQRPDTGLWAGMWQAPTIESDRRLDIGRLATELPQAFRSLTSMASLVRQLTHRTVHVHVHTAAPPRGGIRGREYQWVDESELAHRPLSNAARAVFDQEAAISAS